MTNTAKLTKAQEKKADRERAVDMLRAMFPPGSRVGTVLAHVSRSGMQRTIRVLAPDDGEGGGIMDVSWAVAKAIDAKFDRDRGGVKVGGCGMDMGFHLVYSLAYALYADGFVCVGEGCPSNDHSNGDRDYTPHRHTDPGYTFHHYWI